MASTAIENPQPMTGGESKSARKKKAKAEAVANGASHSPAVPEAPSKDDSSHADTNGTYEHPHIKELNKQIRNINKRLVGLQKTDAVVNANPGVSLEDLVVQRKINVDQKVSLEKKPQLQAQLQQLEEQVKVFRGVNEDYQSQMQRQREELVAQHQKELEKVKEQAKMEAMSSGSAELRKKLLIFSQFLRAAAAKRNEEDTSTDENAAFEGALLLVYGGDQKAVETAVSIIEGSDEQVPSIEGILLPVKCMCEHLMLPQISITSIHHC